MVVETSHRIKMEYQAVFQAKTQAKKVSYGIATQGLDGLSLYMVKKQLMRPAFLRLEKECDSNLGDFFFFALSQPELKAKFEARVDFAKWGEAKDAAAREAGAVHAPSEWIPLRRRSGFGPLNPAHVVFEGVYK